MSVSFVPGVRAVVRRTAAGFAVLALGTGLAAGCAPLRSHQGYIVDVDLVNAIQPGVDNRASVIKTLGNPTIASGFGDKDWYYVARDSRNLNFQKPRVKDQLTLKIAFDAAGTVSSISRGDVKQVASVDLYGKTTPTLGKKRGFFEDLFGNIGTVGAAGTGGGGDAGGDRTQP